MGKLSKDSYLALAELEAKLYLRNQLLRDSDWASMSHGVELRTPFVNFHLLNSLKKIINTTVKIVKRTNFSKGKKHGFYSN